MEGRIEFIDDTTPKKCNENTAGQLQAAKTCLQELIDNDAPVDADFLKAVFDAGVCFSPTLLREAIREIDTWVHNAETVVLIQEIHDLMSSEGISFVKAQSTIALRCAKRKASRCKKLKHKRKPERILDRRIPKKLFDPVVERLPKSSRLHNPKDAYHTSEVIC